MSSNSQAHKTLSKLLENLSLEENDDKFYEYFDKLGSLPHAEKEARFKEFLDKNEQIYKETSNISSVHVDENYTQYQINEYRKKAIADHTFSFAMQHNLGHVISERLTNFFSVNNNLLGSGVDGKPLNQITCANINDWKPDYINEMRTPAFYAQTQPFTSFSPLIKEYLWGNMPAINIVNLASNELADGKSCSNYKGPFNLLFAASGDLNDVIASVNGLPLDFNQQINICINDHAERI
ncbi:18752_t:CDS:2, partial [Racocetra fulgida]